MILDPPSLPSVCSASHNSPFYFSGSSSPKTLPLFAFIREPLSFSQKQASRPSPHSNNAALLSMAVMITSFTAAPGAAFCNTIWPLWALVSPI